ncbi:MAG: hypothetical protein A3J83_03790 [Elusimicrobia bacterium RIFOXYA2_FULL_40_6]|nr:MAG: hypothetical protein A3J83_03790 [Elusimicrobia bacterium RIFOXYA2_FULL_40_6]
MNLISIILITHNRIELLKKCVNSIKKNAFTENFELVILVNGKDTQTAEYLEKAKSEFGFLKYFTTQKASNGRARNIAIQYALGSIYYFIDDDVVLEKNVLAALERKFNQYPEISIIGGPNLTPEGSSLFQMCSGLALSSKFGSGTVTRRNKLLPKDTFVDDKALILCNLAIKRNVFEKESISFDENVACNEENILLYQLEKKGYKMLNSPEIIVYHERKGNIFRHAAQFFKYGFGRGQMTRRFPRSISAPFVIPVFFVFYLAAILFYHKPVFLIPVIFYLILDIFNAFLVSVNEKNPMMLPVMFVFFPAGHIAYGCGVFLGILKGK